MSANQGRVLNESITSVKSDLSEYADGGYVSKNHCNTEWTLNDCNVSYASNTITSNSGSNCFVANVEPNKTYTMSRDKGNRLYILGFNSQPKLGDTGTLILNGTDTSVKSATFNSGSYTWVAIYSNVDATNKATQFQVEEGNEATYYTEYLPSNREISSIKKGLSDIEDRGFYSKNLLNPTLQTSTSNGVTCTRNSDNTYTLNGTPTSGIGFVIVDDYVLPKGRYILTSEMVSPTYSSRVEIVDKGASTYTAIAYDWSGDHTHSTFELTTSKTVKIYLYMNTSYGTANNVVVKPMIRDASISDSTYVPYVPPNTEITTIKESLSDSEDRGFYSPNLLNHSATTQTINNVTFTVNADKSIKVSGTNGSSNINSYSIGGVSNLEKNHRYILSGLGNRSSCYLIADIVDGTNTRFIQPSGTETELEFTLASNETLSRLRVYVIANATVNTTIYPMLRDASISDSTYVPYVPSNRELDSRNDIQTVKPTLTVGTNCASAISNNCYIRNGIIGYSFDLKTSKALSVGEDVMATLTNYKPKNSVAMTSINSTNLWHAYILASGEIRVRLLSGSPASGVTFNIFGTGILA